MKYIKVFGCICYFKDYTQNKSKFSPNAKRGIFLGYSISNNSYIVLEIEENKNKICYTREIYCLEDVPSNYKYNNNKTFDPFFSFIKGYNINNYDNHTFKITNIPNIDINKKEDREFLEELNEDINIEEKTNSNNQNSNDINVNVETINEDKHDNNSTSTPNNYEMTKHDNFENNISNKQFLSEDNTVDKNVVVNKLQNNNNTEINNNNNINDNHKQYNNDSIKNMNPENYKLNSLEIKELFTKVLENILFKYFDKTEAKELKNNLNELNFNSNINNSNNNLNDNSYDNLNNNLIDNLSNNLNVNPKNNNNNLPSYGTSSINHENNTNNELNKSSIDINTSNSSSKKCRIRIAPTNKYSCNNKHFLNTSNSENSMKKRRKNSTENFENNPKNISTNNKNKINNSNKKYFINKKFSINNKISKISKISNISNSLDNQNINPRHNFNSCETSNENISSENDNKIFARNPNKSINYNHSSINNNFPHNNSLSNIHHQEYINQINPDPIHPNENSNFSKTSPPPQSNSNILNPPSNPENNDINNFSNQPFITNHSSSNDLPCKHPRSPSLKPISPKPLKIRKSFVSNNSNQFIANLIAEIPNTFNDAINGPNSEHWKSAIQDELNNLYNNKIMSFVRHVPKGTNIISTKWVFSIKRDKNNNIIKFKARLVARGFRQKFGIDFEITYSPTLNIDSLKFIISLAAKFHWDIFQLDIKAAYLNAPLDKDIYVSIPQGDSNFGGGYWKLNKALYGLKQSGRQWNLTIDKFLKKQNFKPLKAEQCIYIYKENKKTRCIVGLYVDDMIITGEKPVIENIILQIKKEFKISNCGPIEYILGIKIDKIGYKYFISQTSYINNILARFKMQNARPRNTPCTIIDAKTENKNPVDKTKYKSAIGSLIYLAKCTRPDISFAVNKAARKSEEPNESDWKAVTNIFKYIATTKNYKIEYNGEGDFICFTDSDYGGAPDFKSTSGGIILMGNSPICWLSKKQTCVATSTAEAEYVSTSVNSKRILWIKNMLKEIMNYNKPMIIYTDNKASKKTIENGEINSKLKHINIHYHYNIDNILKNKIKLEYINTANMLADPLTKDLHGTKMSEFTNKIFVKNI